jgi:hypothetical protein
MLRIRNNKLNRALAITSGLLGRFHGYHSVVSNVVLASHSPRQRK